MEQTITPEQEAEIKRYESEMTKFYETRLPFIRLQHEYETKKAEVMESRVRMIRANDFMVDYELGKEAAAKNHEKENSTNGSDKN